MPSIKPPHASSAGSISQINQLSETLVDDKRGLHPSEVVLKRSQSQWSLSRESNYLPGDWQKKAKRKTDGTIVEQYTKIKIGTGLVPLSQGVITNFTRYPLQHFQQKAPAVGETLRLGISEKGEVLLAIPNLAVGSVLANAGITPENMENLTTTSAAVKLDQSKARAMNQYWSEVATVADSAGVLNASINLRSRSPFFNIGLQTHYPQHLRLTFQRTENFGQGNLYFNVDTGRQTNLLASLAGLLNNVCFPSPQRTLTTGAVPTSAVTAPATNRNVAQTLGISIESLALHEIHGADTVVIPAAGMPNFNGAAGKSYLSTLAPLDQGLILSKISNLTPNEMQRFNSSRTLPVNLSLNGKTLVFVRSPKKGGSDGITKLTQAYSNLLGSAKGRSHLAVPLISAGGALGFSESESIEAAVHAMDGFKRSNPDSKLRMTLCIRYWIAIS